MYSGIGELLSERPPGDGATSGCSSIAPLPGGDGGAAGLPACGQETAVTGAGSAAGCGLVLVRSVRTAGRRPANRTAKEVITRALVLVAKPAPSPRAPTAIAAAAQRGAPALSAARPSRAMPMSPRRASGSTAAMAPE